MFALITKNTEAITVKGVDQLIPVQALVSR